MITEEKIEKFLKCLDKLINDLAENQKLPIHNKINQFYYMQKIEELKLLKDQVDDQLKLLRDQADDQLKRLKFIEENFKEAYADVFTRWSRDARWLNKYLASSNQAILMTTTSNELTNN